MALWLASLQPVVGNLAGSKLVVDADTVVSDLCVPWMRLHVLIVRKHACIGSKSRTVIAETLCSVPTKEGLNLRCRF